MDLTTHKFYRTLLMSLSVIVLLSAIGTGILAAAQAKPAWFLLIFEVVIFAAGVTGVQFARARGVESPATGLAIIAAAVGVGSLLGFFGSGQAVAGYSMKWWFVARLMLAGAYAAMAAGVIIARNPKFALSALARSVLLGIPVPLVLGALYIALGSSQWTTLPGIVKLGVVVGVGALALCFFAASAHYAIKAFSPRDAAAA